MKIKELPFSAIWDLCRYLDNPNLLHHSGWRGLLSKAPGELAEGRVAFVKFTIEPAQHACKIYTHTYTHTQTHKHTHTNTRTHTHVHTGKIYNALDVSAFERVGQRPNGSPTEAVIQDFITRGFTVDDLYLMLTGIGHAEGMRALQDYGIHRDKVYCHRKIEPLVWWHLHVLYLSLSSYVLLCCLATRGVRAAC